MIQKVDILWMLTSLSINHFRYLLCVSSEEWSQVGDMERGNLGITVEDDGEFW